MPISLLLIKAPTHTTRERFALFPLSGPLYRPVLWPISFQLQESTASALALQLATASLFPVL